MMTLNSPDIDSKSHFSLDEAYAPAPALFARVSAGIELETALAIIAEQRTQISRLESEVMTDSMTGLLNKRGFLKAQNRETDRARRFKETNALLVLFDMDGLKLVNDRHGHLAGDAYIVAFAEQLRQAVRTTDYIARLGGDEFAVLMTDGDPTMMQLMMEAIVDQINHTMARHNDHTFTLSASHGMALVAPGAHAQDVIDEADKKLYRCKAVRKQPQLTAKVMQKASRASRVG